MHIAAKILNKTFDSREFPDEWKAGKIVILFKGRTNNDLNNYKRITLISLVGKILVGILNERLTKRVEKYDKVCSLLEWCFIISIDIPVGIGFNVRMYLYLSPHTRIYNRIG